MDTVGNFLTRIRNAGMRGKENLDVPSSKLCEGVAKVLKDNRYIKDYKLAQVGQKKFMRIYLKYDEKGSHSIQKLMRYSRPGRRVYKKVSEIPRVRSGYGLSILSTSEGILSGKEAYKKKKGGEVLCILW